MNQVEIPNDYFLKMSKKDYSDFNMAIIREFFQNSVDAGATQFVMDYNGADKTVTIYDDGHGMSKDTIVNKLLVMGKSHKASDDAIGAFGHAKILLYFSWPEWEIRTRNYIVSGSSHYYEIKETDDYIDGVISTIKVDDNLSSINYDIGNFFQYCDTDCKVFKVHDGIHCKVEQDLKVGEKIFNNENYDIFKSATKSYYIIIRQNGVFMFNQWLSSSIENSPIVEINKRPEELLLQNRDYFKKTIADEFNEIKREFEVDSIDTFTLKHDKTAANFNTFEMEMASEFIPSEQTNKVITHYMDERVSEKEINRLRSKRLLYIAYAYADKLKELYKVDNIIFGYTKKSTIAGMWRFNSDVGENEIYLNLDKITQFSPNYRHMSVVLLNIVMHEYVHAYNNKVYNSTNHDEKFISALEGMHDYFWDTVPFTKLFKKVWKELK